MAAQSAQSGHRSGVSAGITLQIPWWQMAVLKVLKIDVASIPTQWDSAYHHAGCGSQCQIDYLATYVFLLTFHLSRPSTGASFDPGFTLCLQSIISFSCRLGEPNQVREPGERTYRFEKKKTTYVCVHNTARLPQKIYIGGEAHRNNIPPSHNLL